DHVPQRDRRPRRPAGRAQGLGGVRVALSRRDDGRAQPGAHPRLPAARLRRTAVDLVDRQRRLPQRGWRRTCPLGRGAAVSADDALVEAARVAARDAYAPYSGFAVGAALRCADGRIITGGNVENVSYGLSLCAETVAAA